MSYALYSGEGFVSDLASVEGWSDVVEFLQELGMNNAYPTLYAFASKGYSEQPVKLARELQLLLANGKVRDRDVKDTLTALEKELRNVRDVAIVHDGVS